MTDNLLELHELSKLTGYEKEFTLHKFGVFSLFKRDTFAKAAIEKIFDKEVRAVYSRNKGTYRAGSYRLPNELIVVHESGAIVATGYVNPFSGEIGKWVTIRGPVKEKLFFIKPDQQYLSQYTYHCGDRHQVDNRQTTGEKLMESLNKITGIYQIPHRVLTEPGQVTFYFNSGFSKSKFVIQRKEIV